MSPRRMPLCLVAALTLTLGEARAQAPRADTRGDPLPEGALRRLGTVRLRHTGWGVHAVAFAPDGKVLASAGDDGLVCLWDVATGRELRRFEGHGGPVKGVAFTPDGKTLVSGSHDSSVRLWQVATGRQLRRIDGKGGNWIGAVAVSPDGKLLAFSTGNIAMVRELEGGKEVLESVSHSREVTGLAFSPDSKVLVSATEDGFGTALDVARRNRAENPPAALVAAARLGGALAPDGKLLVSARGEAQLTIQNTDPPQVLRTIPLPRAHRRCVAVSPDGKLVASGDSGNAIRIWEVATGRELHAGPGHRGAGWAVAFSPDGKTLASTGSDGAVRLWDPHSGAERAVLEGHTAAVTTVAFSPDGKRLVSGGQYETPSVRLWDAAGKLLRTLDDGGDRINAVAFTPDGKTVAAVGDWTGKLSLWGAAGERARHVNTGTMEIAFIVFSPRGGEVALACHDRLIRVWDGAVGKELRRLKGHSDAVFGVAYSPDGQTLASCGYDGTVRLWDAATGETRARWSGHAGGAYRVAFSPDGRTLATAGMDGTVAVWETVTGAERVRFRGHRGAARGVAFSPDGRTLASAGLDTTVLLWDVTGMRWRGTRPARPTPAELRALWESLAGAASAAHAAVWALAAAPSESVPLLSKELRAFAVATGPDSIRRLVAALGHARFAAREKAGAELRQLGDLAEAALRRALKEESPLETRRRVELLLRQVGERPLAPGWLRAVRALEALEQAGTAEARNVLAELAEGPPESRIAAEARAMLRRLTKRPPPPG